MKRLFLALLLSLHFFAILHAQEIGVREYHVPLVDKEIHSTHFLQALLEIGNSDVVLPENFPNQTFSAEGPASRLSLMAWNALLKDFGVSLSIGSDALSMTVDLNTFESTLDDFEETFLGVFKIKRTAELIHLSAPGTSGPVVVMLHGLDSSKRLFQGTNEILVDKGYDLYFFEYPNDDRIIRNAERLSQALKNLPKERQQDLSLVTVSMGGVISQLMLETPELAVDGVSRFIACVPPFQGSELASLRGVVELGDHAMNIFFDPKRAFDFWGDGMGRAGVDLHPRSLLMEQLQHLERNAKVKYSILAGNKGIFDPTLLQKARNDLAEGSPKNSLAETARLLSLDRIDLVLNFQSPHGDGVVNLESATLEGVADRVILPYSHLDFLTGFTAKDDIPALKEVLQRLPAVKE
jgi:pimeloyl-ACP methyl ester carboxylesterase